jgi:hypothetical protein
LTNRRSLKIALALIWAIAVFALLGFAIDLLRDFVSAPEQADSVIAPPQPPSEPEEREVRLYFANAEASSLAPEKRLIQLGTGVQADAVAIMDELIKGPQLEGL